MHDGSRSHGSFHHRAHNRSFHHRAHNRSLLHDVPTSRTQLSHARCHSPALPVAASNAERSLLRAYNNDTDSGALWSGRNLTRISKLKASCEQRSQIPGPSSTLIPPPLLRCSDYASRASGWTGVRLLTGVATGPHNRKRRDAIRNTWMRWPNVGRTAVVCFVVGRRLVPNRTLAALDAEAAQFGDLLFLPVNDGCAQMVSIRKAYAFWVAAARLSAGAPSPPFLVKADDDSVVDLPLLERILSPLTCSPRVYIGALAFTGYHPLHFRNCGFAWGGPGAYTKYGCAGTGAHPPFPFALGQLQALSAPLGAALASSPAAREFADAAERFPSLNANEDSAIGYMISRIPRVVYAALDSRTWHNLGCFPAKGLYRQPVPNTSIVVHRLLTPTAIRYVWQVLHDGLTPDVPACQNAGMRWADGPVSRLRVWCERCTGERHKEFPGKAPGGCSEVGSSRPWIAKLREGCTAHGLLPAR